MVKKIIPFDTCHKSIAYMLIAESLQKQMPHTLTIEEKTEAVRNLISIHKRDRNIAKSSF